MEVKNTFVHHAGGHKNCPEQRKMTEVANFELEYANYTYDYLETQYGIAYGMVYHCLT